MLEGGQRPGPQLPAGLFRAAHGGGGLGEGTLLEDSLHDHLALIGPQMGHRVGQDDGLLIPDRVRTGGRNRA